MRFPQVFRGQLTRHRRVYTRRSPKRPAARPGFCGANGSCHNKPTARSASWWRFRINVRFPLVDHGQLSRHRRVDTLVVLHKFFARFTGQRPIRLPSPGYRPGYRGPKYTRGPTARPFARVVRSFCSVAGIRSGKIPSRLGREDDVSPDLSGRLWHGVTIRFLGRKWPGLWPFGELLPWVPGRWPGLGKRMGLWPEELIGACNGCTTWPFAGRSSAPEKEGKELV